MTVHAGIDIGSRTIKLVLLENGHVVKTVVTDTTFEPIAVCRYLLSGVHYQTISATGYGRHLFARKWSCNLISEIKAVGLGAGFLLAGCSTVLDVGGQDTKVVSLDAKGKLDKFLMNDRCAAGSGRFLEVMARALSFTYDQFASAALSATHAEKLNSMCTVFAESEVISLVAQGASREAIALGIHESIATRTLSLMKGITTGDTIMFAGGGAYNPCLRRQIEAGLGRKMHVPENPRIVAALGAALALAPHKVSSQGGSGLHEYPAENQATKSCEKCG
jgi:predicted CoA-substrate-specific enzyme activase